MSDPSEGQPTSLPQHPHHHHHHQAEQAREQEEEEEQQQQQQHQHQQQQHQHQQQQAEEEEQSYHHQHTNGQEHNEQQHPHHQHRSREPTADVDHSSHREGGSDEHHQEQTALWGVPDQLAKILEAARGATSNVKTHAGGISAQPTEEEQRSMYEQARQVFAQMPHLPDHDVTAHALEQYSSRSTEEGVGIGSASQEVQGVGSNPEHGPGIDLANHHGGQSTPPVQRHSSGARQQQYTPRHHKAATAAAITAMDDLSAHDHGGDVGSLSERTQRYGSPEHRSIRSHTDELGDENNAHASGSSVRARGKKGKTIPVGGIETPENERQRKDLHKEVERKRRAGINQAIGELQSLVPDCHDKGVNKGDIILRAAAYIRELKNSEASNIEKWTLEKLLMDQALHDGQIQLEATRAEVERLRDALGKEADSIPGTEEFVRNWGSHDHHSIPDEQHQSQRGQRDDVEHVEQQASPAGPTAHHGGGGGDSTSSASSTTTTVTATTAGIAPRQRDTAAEGETVRTVMGDDVDAVRLAAAVATVRPPGSGTAIVRADVPSATEEEQLRTQRSSLRIDGSESGDLYEKSGSNVPQHTLAHLTGKRDHDGEAVEQYAKVPKTSHPPDGEETKPGA